ncbi:MAG: hypothetical protein WCD86_25385 [Ktedonobacteraceae bacterium]
MECNAPGAIRDEELLAYLAGEMVRPFVTEHLTHCQRCAAQLASYQELESLLTSKLYRLDCPPNEVLGEYQLGMLSAAMTAAVRHHLDICVLCAAEVAALEGFLANDPLLAERAVPTRVAVSNLAKQQNHNHAAPGFKQVLDRLREQSTTGARRILATLIPSQPQVAFQRGLQEEKAWPRRYIAEDINISLQVEQDTNRRDFVQLIGLVTRKGQAVGTLEGMQVQLSSQANDMPQTERVDDLGNFIFAGVAPSTYLLELQLPESVIVIDQLPIDPQR